MPSRKNHHGKRKRDEFEAEDRPNQLGVGQTLALLRDSNETKAGTTEESGTAKKSANDDEWQVVPSRKKSKKNGRDEGSNYPAITHSPHARLQTNVRIGDLQGLVLYLLADGPAPQWVSVRHHLEVRKVVVLMAAGLERDMFNGGIPLDEYPSFSKLLPNDEGKVNSDPRSMSSPDNYYPSKLDRDQLPDCLKDLADMFPHLWPIKTAGDDRVSRLYSPLQSLLMAPLPKTQEEKKMKGAGPRPPRAGKDWEDKQTPVTEYVATYEQLREGELVPHPSMVPEEEKQLEVERRKTENQATENGWVDLGVGADTVPKNGQNEERIVEDPTTAGRKLYAIDCEMCMTGTVFSLTRISVLDWSGTVVYDTLVKPAEPITDYLTQYSGMTAEKLAPITTTLSDVQAHLLTLLASDSILIGHSLNSDLNALKMTHPNIIDTGFLYPHPRGPPLRSSLKWLAQKYLSREIQNGGKAGHDSVEDARAALDLVKTKCKKGPTWGTSDASSESIFKRLGRASRPGKTPAEGINCTGAVVDWGVPARGHGAQADVCAGCSSDDEVVAGVKRAVNGDADGKEIPGGGVDFVWARLRELEVTRGWWNQSRSADNEALLEGARARLLDDGAEDSKESANGQDAPARRPLSAHVAATVSHIRSIYDALPPCTALVVYTGTGDPRELSKLQAQHQQFKKEYNYLKWDELTVKWTDSEEQALKAACRKARDGMGFVVVK